MPAKPKVRLETINRSQWMSVMEKGRTGWIEWFDSLGEHRSREFKYDRDAEGGWVNNMHSDTAQLEVGRYRNPTRRVAT
jgi:hypothetical protein